MRRLSDRCQRTLSRPAHLQGIGYLTGANVHLCFRPAPPSTGIVFIRTDLPSRAEVPATIEQVTGTRRRTTLGKASEQVGLVEHVLAALAGLRIDNCFVELDAPEPPGLDGSSRGFVDALLQAEITTQAALRTAWTVERPVLVRQAGATLALYPGTETLRISYFLDYGHNSPIPRQHHTEQVTTQNFLHELASCRTFILESEAAELRRQGLGLRTTAADLLVFGAHGLIGNRLRFADEPARHKILDLLGDLALFGHDLCGHVVAYRSGHPLNIELARTLRQQLGHDLAPARDSRFRCAA